MDYNSGAKKTDRLFLLYVASLLLIGLIVLASASAPYSFARFGDVYYFVKRQILFGLLPGLTLFLIAGHIPYAFWKKISAIFYLGCLILLVLVFIPGFGANFDKGAHSWIDIGFIHFQPAELLKLGLVMILALMLSDIKRDLSDIKNGILPILYIIIPSLLLIILQPDIGTLVVLGGIILGMFFLAKIPKIYLALMICLGVILVAIMIMIAPYRLNRVMIFMHPELDPQGIGYHVNQSYLAVGSGGLWGLGYGHSRQKHLYLPEVHGDSIFAVMAEEFGFILTLGFLVLFLGFTWRGLRLAKNAPDNYGYLLISGIMIWFFWQSFINIGAMVGILPLTGVTLPFISHGGTSLMVSLAAIGVVSSVNRAS